MERIRKDKRTACKSDFRNGKKFKNDGIRSEGGVIIMFVVRDMMKSTAEKTTVTSSNRKKILKS